MQYDHPLAGRKGALAEHRKVLYDKIGPGPHSCHWCGEKLEWLSGERAMRGIIADHLNGVITDNRPENIVPACNSCNVHRRPETYLERF